ncbi:hypothetical protein [Aquimarina algiphila]|uniref:hypothetical protein n=1 Tax=Aquimarina algiphila TaxID=2047982 RepID=UPI00232BB398|nr:hypothetical protein [Aquimarina algiphila]
MKNYELDKDRNKFISSIIESIRMNVNDFMQNLADGKNYEITIYEWSINLFNEGKSIKDSIEIIHNRRMLVLLNGNYEFSIQNKISRNHQKVMRELKMNPTYFKLKKSQKEEVQTNIDHLVETNLYFHPEIVQMILELIKHKFFKNQFKIKEMRIIKEEKELNRNSLSNLLSKYIEPKLTISEIILRSSNLN